MTIASGIYPPDKGGPAQFAHAFSQWLVSQGISTTVISLTDGGSRSQTDGLLELELISRKENLLFRYIRTAIAIGKKSKGRVLLINGVFLETLLASFFFPLKYVAKVPGDIVWERARNQGRTNFNIDDYQGTEDFFKRIMRSLFVRSLNRSSWILAPSEHMASLIKSWGVTQSKIRIVRNSVDLSLFSEPKDENEKKYDLVTVCRLTPWKGVAEVISEAAARDLSLCVIGSGPELDNLKDHANKLQAKVTFLGELEQASIPKYLGQSRCFVLNSAYEGSPHALLEAMALGSVVIARDSTGTREVIQDLINGILCGGNRSLGDSLDLVFDSGRELLHLQGAASKTIQEHYERNSVFRNILNLLQEIS